MYEVIVLGAGASGVFLANQLADLGISPSSIVVLERGSSALAKLKVSGGGRCNVTHFCYDPKVLVSHYPRGHKELLGPFYRFQPKDTQNWFLEKGVQLKVEEDGRMFPVTDSSQTVIDALLKNRSTRFDLKFQKRITNISKNPEGGFVLSSESEIFECRYLVVATGGAREPYAWLEALGHTIIPPIPSLFTFNLENHPLSGLSGVSLEKVTVSLPSLKCEKTGPMLITHWGLSGPCILKLSAWSAEKMHECDYKTDCRVDWLPDLSKEVLREMIFSKMKEGCKKNIVNDPILGIPKQLWKYFIEFLEIKEGCFWSSLEKQKREALLDCLKNSSFVINGKSLYKQEFVTCGGVELSEVNFKTMESKRVPGLYFCGEVLNIDGVTGGFNFQAAWTTAFLAAQEIFTQISS